MSEEAGIHDEIVATPQDIFEELKAQVQALRARRNDLEALRGSDDFDTSLMAQKLLRIIGRDDDAQATDEDIAKRLQAQRADVLEKAQNGTYADAAGMTDESSNSRLVDVLGQFLQKNHLQLTEDQLMGPGGIQVTRPPQNQDQQ